MCIKTLYFDTYPDGTQKVSERVETCRAGHMCSQPKIKEYHRQLPQKVHVVDVERAPHKLAERPPYHHDYLHLPPSPRRSQSPSPSGSEGRRRRESGIFINGAKIVDLKRRSTMREREHHDALDRGRDRSPRALAVDVHQPPFAPEPPSPRLHRTSTMPAGNQHPDYVVIEERQPRANAARRMSRDVPQGAVQRFENAGLGLARRPSVTVAAAHAPLRRSPAPATAAAPFVLVDDERERADRRRRRADLRPAQFVGAAAVASGSDTTATSDPQVREAVYPSAATAAVRKELRWEDQQRAAQNARIAMRPKLHQEPRGILKHPDTARPVVVVPEREKMAVLRRSMTGLEIDSREAAARRLSTAAGKTEDELMKDRLAARFVLGGDAERRRGTRVYYPGEGLYKYL